MCFIQAVLASFAGSLKCEESSRKAGPDGSQRQWTATTDGLKTMKHRTCKLGLIGLAAGWLFLSPAWAADKNATADTNATKPAAAESVPPGSQKVYGLPAEPEKFAPQSANLMTVMLRVFGALLVVLALLLGGAWWFRKSRLFGLVPAHEAKLKILETKSLGSRHSMHVVTYGEQRFLISDSPAGTHFLTHLEHPGEDLVEAEPMPQPEPGSFADKLKSLIQRAK